VVLLSAIQDFEGRTLSAVPGLLGKLRYVALLCKNKGEGFHWGLQKIYGSGAAEKAIKNSHRALIGQVLRTPLRDLEEDLRHSAARAQVTEFELLACFGTSERNAPPVQNFRASEKHFMSVLHTLSALAQHNALAIPQNVLPPPPPAQSPRPPVGA
jgi:hypothetical protein